MWLLMALFACSINGDKVLDVEIVPEKGGDKVLDVEIVPEKGGEKLVVGDGYQAVLIPSGTFQMGCTSGDSDCYDDESPVHKVTISRDFYLMESEVTQGLYESVMGSNPSKFKGSSLPVEEVSWFDAVEFANKLSAKEGLEECYLISGDNVSWSNKDCNGWRLPTESEWEYAARGSESYKYAGSSSVDSVAWYGDNSGGKTHDVCGKQKNGYGLCDMSGNVFEWVWDWMGDYSSSVEVDPKGASEGSDRVVRGGSWFDSAGGSRVSLRLGLTPVDRGSVLGFRLLRIP
jgi:formylglycine-generating enzyme required for sulfatase activity